MYSLANKAKRSLCLLLVLTVITSLFVLTVGAEREQDMVLMSVHASNVNPEAGETITVTVKIDNYSSMRPKIQAMHVGVLYDQMVFDYVQGSETVEMKTYSGDAVSLIFDGENTVELFYTYANASGSALERDPDMKLFSFQLRVKSGISVDTSASFAVTADTFYSHDDKYIKIGVREPIIDTLNVWVTRPIILINNSAANANTYDKDVTLQFPSTAQLVYNGREPVTVTSPYTCSLNGTYMIALNHNGVAYSQTFTIAKTIRYIGINTNSINSEYALGIEPDYSLGKLRITYSDNSTVEIPMNDPDVKISGYDKNTVGKQYIKVEYQGMSTTFEVTVKDKTVKEIAMQAAVEKKDYLVGDTVDPTGGMLFVVYDDNTKDNIPLSSEMLSGYDNTEPGEKSVTVTYGEIVLEDAFKVTYFLRNKVDALISQIDSLVIEEITVKDYDKIVGLKSVYDSLTELEKSAVLNYNKLNDAIVKVNDSISAGTGFSGETQSPGDDTTRGGNRGNTSFFKYIIYIIAIIVAISVIAGGTYFLIVYLKRKRDDKTEFYYTEEEDVDGEFESDDDFDDESDDIDDYDYEDEQEDDDDEI